MKHVIPTLLALALLASCKGDTKPKPDAVMDDATADAAAPARVVRLDRLAAVPDSLGADMPGVALWMAMSGSADITPAEFARSNRIAAFLPDVEKRFTDTDTLSRRLGAAFVRLDLPRRTVYTIVSPYMQSVVLAGDTAVFVALNHYLGAGHPAYAGFPEHQRKVKTPERITADVVEAILAGSHPYGPTSTTALSRMLYDGALLEGIMRATGMSEAEAMGYTPGQAEWADTNLAAAWDALLQRKLLFSTDPSVGERLVNPAPSTSVLNPGSPGRLGRLIGHRIVAAYLSGHPDTSLDSLLSPGFYDGRQTLADSGFSPR